jgi:protein-S-isoprenylcysteine O-methyltransferase Ste14
MSDKTKGNFLVAAQFGLLAALVLIPRQICLPANALAFALNLIGLILLLAGFVVLAIGLSSLGKSLTAHPVPMDNSSLVTTGLYKLVRHPIYSGLLLIGLGVTVQSYLLPHIIVWAVLWLLLEYKAGFEETMLEARYPEYADYKAKTGRFIPKLRR